MTTITIPKKLIKDDDLVIIPRREFERVLGIAKKRQYTEFDRQLDKIIEEVREGKVIGPFSSIKALKNSLEK